MFWLLILWIGITSATDRYVNLLLKDGKFDIEIKKCTSHLRPWNVYCLSIIPKDGPQFEPVRIREGKVWYFSTANRWIQFVWRSHGGKNIDLKEGITLTPFRDFLDKVTFEKKSSFLPKTLNKEELKKLFIHYQIAFILPGSGNEGIMDQHSSAPLPCGAVALDSEYAPKRRSYGQESCGYAFSSQPNRKLQFKWKNLEGIASMYFKDLTVNGQDFEHLSFVKHCQLYVNKEDTWQPVEVYRFQKDYCWDIVTQKKPIGFDDFDYMIQRGQVALDKEGKHKLGFKSGSKAGAMDEDMYQEYESALEEDEEDLYEDASRLLHLLELQKRVETLKEKVYGN